MKRNGAAVQGVSLMLYLVNLFIRSSSDTEIET
jgi:hypothetical protein